MMHIIETRGHTWLPSLPSPLPLTSISSNADTSPLLIEEWAEPNKSLKQSPTLFLLLRHRPPEKRWKSDNRPQISQQLEISKHLFIYRTPKKRLNMQSTALTCLVICEHHTQNQRVHRSTKGIRGVDGGSYKASCCSSRPLFTSGLSLSQKRWKVNNHFTKPMNTSFRQSVCERDQYYFLGLR